MQVQVSDNKKLQRIYKGLEIYSGENKYIVKADKLAKEALAMQ